MFLFYIIMLPLQTVLGWCLYCLAMYKEHQEECRREVREILTGRDSDDITWWTFINLLHNYVDNTITGRICPNSITLQCVLRRHWGYILLLYILENYHQKMLWWMDTKFVKVWSIFHTHDWSTYQKVISIKWRIAVRPCSIILYDVEVHLHSYMKIFKENV